MDEPTPHRNWSSLHEASLKQNQPERWKQLRQTGDLKEYLRLVDREAQETFELIRDRHLKKPSWTMDQAERMAEEIVLNDSILVPDRETSEAMNQGGYLD